MPVPITPSPHPRDSVTSMAVAFHIFHPRLNLVSTFLLTDSIYKVGQLKRYRSKKVRELFYKREVCRFKESSSKSFTKSIGNKI
jgi:hypothetical protein